jgi:hypothetical protein
MTARHCSLPDWTEAVDDHVHELVGRGLVALGSYRAISRLLDEGLVAAEAGDAHRVAAICQDILGRVRCEMDRGGRPLQ